MYANWKWVDLVIKVSKDGTAVAEGSDSDRESPHVLFKSELLLPQSIIFLLSLSNNGHAEPQHFFVETSYIWFNIVFIYNSSTKSY